MQPLLFSALHVLSQPVQLHFAQCHDPFCYPYATQWRHCLCATVGHCVSDSMDLVRLKVVSLLLMSTWCHPQSLHAVKICASAMPKTCGRTCHELSMSNS